MKTGDIARTLGLEIIGNPDQPIHSAAAMESATPEQVAYVESEKHFELAAQSRAGCLIVRPEAVIPDHTCILSLHPKYDFVRVVDLLHPLSPADSGVHPTAIVPSSVLLGPEASVGPYCVIEGNVVIGARSRIEAFCFIGRDCRLSEDVHLHPRVTLYPSVQLAPRTVIHAGTVIGSDGFGYVFHAGRYTKFPQIGGVEIAEDVEIGSNVTIDRGALGTTRIGRGTKIDNLVQVAHNVTIGEDCVIAAQTGISGSSTIERQAVIAGQVGIADHVRIEEKARVGAQAGIPTGKIVRQGEFVWGTPARPMEVFKEQYGGLSRLPRLRQEVSELKKKVAQLEDLLKNQIPTT
jgi:UDP-3-O-[3-hydroxymyristoyl] glucosamine N-acyltransferase